MPEVKVLELEPFEGEVIRFEAFGVPDVARNQSPRGVRADARGASAGLATL